RGSPSRAHGRRRLLKGDHGAPGKALREGKVSTSGKMAQLPLRVVGGAAQPGDFDRTHLRFFTEPTKPAVRGPALPPANARARRLASVAAKPRKIISRSIPPPPKSCPNSNVT